MAYGVHWGFSGLRSYDRHGQMCVTNAPASGNGNRVKLLAGIAEVYVTYTLSLSKNTHHGAAEAKPRSVTLRRPDLGKIPAGCSGQLTAVTSTAAESPNGSGNGGDSQNGFYGGFLTNPVLDRNGIQLPQVDLSGNGSCPAQPDNTYPDYGVKWHAVRFDCVNGVVAIPIVGFRVDRADGTACYAELSGVGFLSVPPSTEWSGSVTPYVGLDTYNSTGTKATHVWKKGAVVSGTGTTSLCSLVPTEPAGPTPSANP